MQREDWIVFACLQRQELPAELVQLIARWAYCARRLGRYRYMIVPWGERRDHPPFRVCRTEHLSADFVEDYRAGRLPCIANDGILYVAAAGLGPIPLCVRQPSGEGIKLFLRRVGSQFSLCWYRIREIDGIRRGVDIDLVSLDYSNLPLIVATGPRDMPVSIDPVLLCACRAAALLDQ